MKIRKTNGLIAAPPTGFLNDKTVDYDVIRPLAAHLQKSGVAGVFVNGTTGEGASLTIKERKSIAAEWRQVIPAGMKLFIHVGLEAAESAIELARHSREIGADAIAVIAPGFYKPAGIKELTNWCLPIAKAAADVPFYFYHMPAMTGVQINAVQFLEYAGSHIPNLAGIKFTHEALAEYMDALHLQKKRFDLLWGRDEMLLGALAMGAEGGVGSTYNVFCPLYLRLIENYRKGNQKAARRLQLKAIQMINIMAASGNFFSALKAILQSQGVPILPITRPPLMSLTNTQSVKLTQEIAALNI